MTDPHPEVDAALPRGSAMASEPLAVVHFDGACQPPAGGGIAAYGFTVTGAGIAHEEGGLAVRPGSPASTNNVAEYTAAIRALEWLLARGYEGPVVLHGDSQLVVRQMRGEYRVRAPHLLAYHERLAQLAGRFRSVTFVWVPRSHNTRADALSKLAIAREIRLPTAGEDTATPGSDPKSDRAAGAQSHRTV